MQEIQGFEGIKIRHIDNIPYVLGAESIKKVFERLGIKKSKKAVYKFISKTSWKRRVKENGKSVIAVPIYEIERWAKKNYPMAIQEDEGKEYISKSFGIIDNFQKIIDDINSNISQEVPDIFLTPKDTDEKTEDINKILLEKLQNFIKTLLSYPPSQYEKSTLEKIKGKILFVYEYIENITKLKDF